VLGEWQNKLRWNGQNLDFLGCRYSFSAFQAQPAMKFSEVECRRSHAADTIVMQSTGHGARQSSQPVHSDAIMVCIN